MTYTEQRGQIWHGKTSYLLAFSVVWAVYFGLIGFFDFTSRYDNFSLALAYQGLFIALSFIPVLVLPMPKLREPDGGHHHHAAIWISLGLAVFGIISLFIDKMINGVDYTAGICTARYQMNRIAAARDGGVSSIYSVVGNLFATSFFVAVAVVMMHNVSRRMYYATFSIAFACLMALAIVASSRSPILLFGAFFLALICLRLFLYRAIRIQKVDVAFGAVMVACALLFVGSVFGCRATMSKMTATEYQESFAPYLGVETRQPINTEVIVTPLIKPSTQPKEPVITASKDAGIPASAPWQNASGILGMTVLYATHSAYTFAGIISAPPESAPVMFKYPMDLMARIGLMQPRTEKWSLSGRFTSVPGGLYHDFGLVGMLAGSVFMGFAVWLAMCLVRKIANSVVLLGAASMALTIMFLSPIHFAAEFASFPFTCFSFVVVGVLVKTLEKFPRRWVGEAMDRGGMHP